MTSGRGNNDVDFTSNLLSLEIEDHGFVLTKAEELNNMISGEDESSSILNGRLRPRKSTAIIPNPPNKSTHKPENKVAQDKAKRNSTPSKASPNKQDDLTAKADSPPIAQFLCPYCDKKFTTKLSGSKHARRIHLSTSKQDNFINCLFCNQSEAVPTNIIRHMVDNHPNQYFACLDCNIRFLSTSELAEHKLNVCEKQRQAYRSKLRQKTPSLSKKDQKKVNAEVQNNSEEKQEPQLEPEFNGVVISCELKPSQSHDAVDIEDNITTNLILPSNIGNSVLEKNAVIILDDIQWNRRIPLNFSFRNADADQILSRLGVVHRSPRVGESTRREWLKMIDVSGQKFEKCFDTSFYSKVASNVQQNLARFLDGSFNFSPDPDKVIKTRKSKSSAIINTAEGFPILLPHEQYSRNRFDGYMPRAIAPKHKWKWDSTENEKNIIIDASVMKRDNHVDNCIITLVSSLDIWTQLRMRRKFEGVFCKAATDKIEKQNIIGRELKEILESREIPCSSSQVVAYTGSTAAATVAVSDASDFPSFLGLSARPTRCERSMQPAVLSGEWVRPRCYVCCACGDQTSDSRALSAHMAAHHSNAQVQHYEIVGESLLNADILKHLYVPPSQMSNRTRPLRGFRDCTKCKKSITMEDLHQHMLDCAGDTPTVRRKCRSRPFGVRRRRPRLPDNTIRKKIRKDLRTRHNQKALLRARPRIRTEVGDAETIRKMIADLPAKRHRQAAGNTTQKVLRPRRKLDKQRNKLKIKRLTSKDTKTRKILTKNDTIDLSIIDEDDQPLKPKTKIEPKKTVPTKKRVSNRVASKNKKDSAADKKVLLVNDQQNTPTGDAKVSQPQKISSDNSSQRLTNNAKGNDNKGKEDDQNGSKNNDNGDNGKETPNEERDEGNHKSVPKPTLLKHSINNITASSNRASQSPQQCILPQQPNDGDTARDTHSTFLVNEVQSTLPDKPPLQKNQKRFSEKQKKRESLLNCIEKIKSQQKGETMYDPRHMSLLDPNPAIISHNLDESGAPMNVLPVRLEGHDQRQDVAGALYPTWSAETDMHRTMNMLASIATPLYVHPNPETVLVPVKPTVEQMRKIAAGLALKEQFDPRLRVAQIIFQNHFRATGVPCTPSAYAQIQQQIDQSLRLTFNEFMLHQQAIEYLKNQSAYYGIQNLLSEQYNISELQYEGRRDNPRHNETVPLLTLGSNQQNPILLSTQPWARQPLQIPQINSNHNQPVMLPSMAPNDLVILTHQGTPQNRVSESSETCGSLEDAGVLSYARERRFSADTTHTFTQRSQEIMEPSHDHEALSRSGVQERGECVYQGRDKTNRNYEDRSSYSDSMNNGTDLYQTPQSQYYMPQFDVEEQQSNQRSINKNGNSRLENYENIDANSFICSNLDNRKLHERYNSQPHLFTSTPSEYQTAKITASPNFSNNPNSNDIYSRDQSGDGPVSSNRVIDRHKHTSYGEARDHHKICVDQADSISNEEPLDLSGKHAPAIIINDNMTNVCAVDDQTVFRAVELSKTNEFRNNRVQRNIGNSEKIATDIDLFENHVSDLSYENSSPSIDTVEEIIDVEKPSQPNCPTSSTVYYYKETNDMEISSYQNIDESNYLTKTPNTFTGQSSYEKATENKKILNQSVIESNINDLEESNLASTSQSSNYYLSHNVGIPIKHLEKRSINFPQPLENQSSLETTEATDANSMQSNNFSYDYRNTEVTQMENHYSSKNYQQNTANHEDGAYAEQNIAQIELHSAAPTLEKTCVANDNVANWTSSLVDQDPETAKKIASFPKELVDLLGTVPKEQHNRFVNVISQLIPPANHEETTPAIIVEKPENVAQPLKNPSAESNTPPICDTLMNTENRLTINTASLPSSSILPKKRHSPSARLTSQEVNSNSTLSRSSPEPKRQTLSTMNSIPDINLNVKSVSSGIDYTTNPIIKKVSEVDECEATTGIDKIIDLTNDDVNLKTTPNIHNTNILAIQNESVYKLPVTIKHSNEQTASLRAVRIKTPLVRKSISDDKQPMITKETYNPQPILHQKDSNTPQISYPEYVYRKFSIDSGTSQNSEYHASTIINQAETRTPTQNDVQIESETAKLQSDCEQIQHGVTSGEFEMNDGFLTKPNEINNDDHTDSTTLTSVMQHSHVANNVETKNNTFSSNKVNKFDNIENAENITAKVVPRKNTEFDTNLQSKIITFDSVGNSSQIHANILNPIATSSVSIENHIDPLNLFVEKDAVIPDYANINCPQQNHKITDILLDTEKNIVDAQAYNMQQEQVINTNENTSNTIITSEPEHEILQQNLCNTATPKTIFSEDEDSEDDISLAIILQQKRHGQTTPSTSSENVASSSSFMNINNTPKLTRKEKKSKNKSKISSRCFLQISDPQLSTGFERKKERESSENVNNKDNYNEIQTNIHQMASSKAEIVTKPRGIKNVRTETIATVFMTDSDLSNEPKDTSERVLRRSRRRKSMLIENKNATDETMNTVVNNQASAQKIPVTKKQLIFSKLLLDKNAQSKNDYIQSTIETTEPAKRKISPEKAKSKKKKITHSKYINNDNIDREQFLESGAIENQKEFQLSDNNSEVHKEKRKINNHYNDTNDSPKAKITRNNNKNDKTLKYQESTTKSITVTPDTEKNVIRNNEESGESSQFKLKESFDNPIAGTSGYYNIKKKSEKTGTEIRTACYNRPMVSKQTTSVHVKNPSNYDPYDINLDMDMAETSKPIIIRKKKVNKTSSRYKTSKKVTNYNNRVNKLRHKKAFKKTKMIVSSTLLTSVSDSDSSINDVPLQKYLDEKKKVRNDSSQEHSSEVVFQSVKNNTIQINYEPVTVTSYSPLPTNSTDETNGMSDRKDDSTDISGETHQSLVQPIENIAGPSTVNSNRQKRNSRPTTSKNSCNAPNETPNDEQPTSDMYLANFGFFYVKQHRKSNLLASKKISETFHQIDNDDDDFYSENRQRKSSHSENRKNNDAVHTKVTKDATNANFHKKSSTAQATSQQEAETSNTAVEEYLPNEDGEVDPITAQKMLDSEEIKKLERDLYTGFKEAAEANAGKTSGFNQLRAEDTNMRDNNNKDVSSPIEDDTVEMESIKSPERPDSPERYDSPDRSESPEMPESPESLKDKPLMYPEEEVNIYEDKYDIIKRRREASANAKQAQKVDKPKKSNNEKSKKKPERKNNKKRTKKPTYQGSQVPTKGALKGFDGIKISIPTQDLNMPPNVSPPQQQQQRQSRSKKRKASSGKTRPNSGSSSQSDSDPISKVARNPDVYEFQDSSTENEDKPLTKIRKEKKRRKINSKTTEQKNLNKKWKGKGQGKGKGKNTDEQINKKTESPRKEEENTRERQRDEKELGKLTDKSKLEMDYNTMDRTITDEDDGLSNDYNNTSATIQDNEETFTDSDIEDQTIIPGTSGFVPDRNDESSYESDSSSTTPLLSALEGPFACTCLSEIESDDSETERGCAHSSCRYSHLNAAKNAVMGKIFKNNAVRCDKSDDTTDEPPKPKPDLDRLFDSLLEPTTDNNDIPTRGNTSADSGPSSTTYFFTSHVKPPHEALVNHKPIYEKDVSNIDDGFSSPNHRNSEKDAKKLFECGSQTSPNNTNSLKIDDDSINNFGEPTNASIDNVYIMVSQKHIQTEDPAELEADSSDEPMDDISPDEPEQSNTNLRNNGNTSEDSLDNLDKVPESSDYIKLKSKRVEVRKTRGTQTKRPAPRSCDETSSCDDEIIVAKLTKKNRRVNKKHKSHHKRNKGDRESGKKHSGSKSCAASKRKKAAHNAVEEENETESEEKRRFNEKLSPSRKSDEGISTSHDNSADAYDMAPAEETGVAVQRARRKCTVGKQNVLAEHWSSSESEDEPAPKQKKNSTAKKNTRSTKKDRGGRRTREVVDTNKNDERTAAGRSRPRRTRRARTTRRRNKKDEELHGWIVGVSHKKLVTMLVCSKSKSRPDDIDGEEIENDKE